MENKIKEKINLFLLGDKKRIKIIVVIGLIGMLLILASEILPSSEEGDAKADNNQMNYSEYTKELENRLTEVISEIDGVGECKVMITLENTVESVYATNNEIKTDDSSLNEKDEYVLYESSGDESPVLIKEYMPKVRGVTVVCSGGDDIVTKEKIINSVTALFNLPTNRVSVSKIKEKR